MRGGEGRKKKEQAGKVRSGRRLSSPAQGRDATLSFGMKGPVSLSFLPLSPGEGYRLHHWSLIAEEKGVGGTPSFRNKFIF